MNQEECLLEDCLDQVSDRETFLTFVKALVEDRKDSIELETVNPSSPYGSEAGGWENTTLESFLEAALAWAVESKQLPNVASWKAFAEFLYCGKIYE
jgi:hypothetical protein